jgi:hypothetical protein
MIIGIGCRARQGKDTLASMIHATLPRESCIYHFGDALKATARLMGWMREKDGVVLQCFGDVVGHDRVVEALRLQIEEENSQIAIIADVRCPAEYNWIINHNGYLVNIERLNEDGSRFVDPSRPADHWSEISLHGRLFHKSVISKTGDFNVIERAADRIVEMVLSGKMTAMGPPTIRSDY